MGVAVKMPLLARLLTFDPNPVPKLSVGSRKVLCTKDCHWVSHIVARMISDMKPE